MKLYAVETTDRMQLCKINARNIKLFKEKYQANCHAVNVALQHRGAVREKNNIMLDKELDKTTKVYDKSEGKAEEAEALAFITRIEI